MSAAMCTYPVARVLTTRASLVCSTKRMCPWLSARYGQSSAGCANGGLCGMWPLHIALAWSLRQSRALRSPFQALTDARRWRPCSLRSTISRPMCATRCASHHRMSPGLKVSLVWFARRCPSGKRKSTRATSRPSGRRTRSLLRQQSDSTGRRSLRAAGRRLRWPRYWQLSLQWHL